jgi:outer membrane lipoprotein-sorting protein
MVSTGCSETKPKTDFEKARKKLLGLSTYTCDVTMRVTNNRSTMEYELKHFYESPHKYRIEVIAPKELQGQITIFNGRSSYIYHPGIDQYLITENFSDSAEYNAFIGSFIEYIKKGDDIKVSYEKEGDKGLIVLEFEILKPNRYMRFEKLWIDAKAIVPLKAEIYGSDGKTSVEVYYDNFVYNPCLKDEDFEIIGKILKKHRR